jgi:hypothetical protein
MKIAIAKAKIMSSKAKKVEERSVRRNLKVETHGRVRKKGLTGSEQNKLRQSLYKMAWERINAAMADEYYLEVICCVDSIISDRLFAVVQTIKHEDKMQYPMLGAGNAIEALALEYKDGRISSEHYEDEGFTRCLLDVGSWLHTRNVLVHGLVSVENEYALSAEERLKNTKQVAKAGKAVAKTVQRETKRMISILKRQPRISM